MLRTRLWMGSLLIILAIGLFLEGRWTSPWFPGLMLTFALGSYLATRELLSLIPPGERPHGYLIYPMVAVNVFACWLPAWGTLAPETAWPKLLEVQYGLVASTLVIGTLIEMRRFTGPDRIVARLGLSVFVVVYLGILPGYLVQLRHLAPGTAMLFALAIFVPKCNDIGAYFTGKFLTGKLLGRTPMTPSLSPKKTWQGAVGGMIASVVVAYGFNQIDPVLGGPWWRPGLFGLVVGLAGILGDLAESLIKRDCQTKDASQSVPGFGGVLDVIDSLLFAAPVAYLWFRYVEQLPGA